MKITRGGYPGLFKKDPLEGVNLQEEVELILQKKSNLSANLRRLVLHRVEQAKKLEQLEKDGKHA